MARQPETADSNDGPNLRSERAIHDELLAARKRPQGLSPQMMAQCPVMCDVLGNGDPEVAHVQLSLKLLEMIEAEDDVMALEADCYSLGLTTESNTHLRRLEEFGENHFIDQRQARRHSDRGLKQLARLIASNWTTYTVPEATVIIVGTGDCSVGFTIRVRCQRHVDMRKPQVSLWNADNNRSKPQDVEWRRTSDDGAAWIEDEFVTPRALDVKCESAIRLIWRGEAWPKFTIALTGKWEMNTVTSETLGAMCLISISPQL